MHSVWKAITGAALAGAVLTGTVGDASATTARKIYNRGHGYYGARYHHRYYGGNPALGAAVAGTALGIVGLAAGAAAADSYGYGNGPGYGYGPGYAPGYYAPAPDYDEDLF